MSRPPEPSVLTVDELAYIGTLLYGRQWINAMSEDLDVNRRTAQRWASGNQPIRQHIVDALVEKLEARIVDIRSEIQRLK